MDNHEPFLKAWYNKLGIYKRYESIDPEYKWCFINLKSHNEEDNIQTNIVSIGFGPKYRSWVLPFTLIKRVYDYPTYDYNGKDYYQLSEEQFKERNIPIKYKNYAENEWEIRLDEHAFVIQFSKPDQLLYNRGNHKPLVDIYWWIPWKNKERTKNLLLDIDGHLHMDISNHEFLFRKKSCIQFDDIMKFEDAQPSIKFLFLDYDGEEIIATCKRSYSEYSMGSGKWTRAFFKLFRVKPDTYQNLDLDFNKEVGSEKGSWKGGICGMSIEMTNDESAIDSFNRFCIGTKGITKRRALKDLKFIQKIDKFDNSRPYAVNEKALINNIVHKFVSKGAKMVPDYNSLTMEEKHFVDKLVKDFNMSQEEALQWVVDNGLTEPDLLADG